VSKERRLDRRGFLARGLATASAALLGGCEDLSDQTWVKKVLDSAETLTRVTQEALLSPQALAREFGEADISRDFRANGSTDPEDPAYVSHAKNGFVDWKLVVGGLVDEPLARTFACRTPRHAVAHADHAARLRRGLELHR
jgi:DMSO/TMAO reductase YedYZ molybdopterin-dependent catalytic subunit